MRFLSVVLALMTVSPTAGAQELVASKDIKTVEEMSLDDLLGVVEAPSNYQQPVSQAPSTVTVITREQIERCGVRTLPELLRFVPGVDVFMNTHDSYNVSIRGMNEVVANNVVVLIDGHAVTSQFDGQVDWSGLPIAVEEIERIEVVRGPVSAVFGANAFTGVINIVRRAVEQPSSTKVHLDWGDHYTFRVGGRHADWREKMGYRVSVAHRQGSALLPPGAEDARTTAFNLTGRAHPYANGSVEVSLGSSFSSQHLLSATLPQGVGYQAATLLQTLSFEHQEVGLLRGDRIELSQTYHQFQLLPQSVDRLAQDLGRIEYQKVDADLSYHFSVSRWDEIRLSGLFSYVDAESPAIAGGGEGVPYYAVAGQVTLKPMERVRISGAGRWDYNAFVHDHGRASWRGSAIFLPTPQHAIRLTGGSAFRNPTFIETIGDFRDGQSGLIYMQGAGSEAIEPPMVQAGELGYRGLLLGSLVVDVTGFVQQIRNLIQPLPQQVPSSFGNVGERLGFGGELELRYELKPYLTALGGYAYQYIQDRETEIRLDNNPEHKGHLGLGSSWPSNLQVYVGLQYVSSHRFSALAGIPPTLLQRDIDARFLFNGRVAYTFPGLGLTLALHGVNLIGPGDRLESPFTLATEYHRRFFISIDWQQGS